MAGRGSNGQNHIQLFRLTKAKAVTAQFAVNSPFQGVIGIRLNSHAET
jgi:hypothetical protein